MSSDGWIDPRLEGPRLISMTREKFTAALEEAAARERERCAKIADAEAVDAYRNSRAVNYRSPDSEVLARYTAERIATRIRGALATTLKSEAWTPTHRHRKGGLYRVIARGKLEWNLEPAVIYESRDGHVWVRPEAEFEDGRFTSTSPGESDD